MRTAWTAEVLVTAFDMALADSTRVMVYNKSLVGRWLNRRYGKSPYYIRVLIPPFIHICTLINADLGDQKLYTNDDILLRLDFAEDIKKRLKSLLCPQNTR